MKSKRHGFCDVAYLALSRLRAHVYESERTEISHIAMIENASCHSYINLMVAHLRRSQNLRPSQHLHSS